MKDFRSNFFRKDIGMRLFCFFLRVLSVVIRRGREVLGIFFGKVFAMFRGFCRSSIFKVDGKNFFKLVYFTF